MGSYVKTWHAGRLYTQRFASWLRTAEQKEELHESHWCKQNQSLIMSIPVKLYASALL